MESLVFSFEGKTMYYELYVRFLTSSLTSFFFFTTTSNCAQLYFSLYPFVSLSFPLLYCSLDSCKYIPYYQLWTSEGLLSDAGVSPTNTFFIVLVNGLLTRSIVIFWVSHPCIIYPL